MTEGERHTVKEIYAHGALSEEEIEALLDRSLDPTGPDVLFDMAGKLGLGPRSEVLDVGCRDGRQAIELVRRFACRVTGVEPVEDNLRRGRELVAAAGPELADRIRLVRGVAEALPVADASFDLVWCRDVLIHVEPLGDALAEFRRTLRPGGAALIFTMFATAWLEPDEAARLWPPLGAVPENTDPERFERLVGQAGLTVERGEVLGSQWREFGEESGDGRTSRQLLRVARLLRDPERYIAAMGEVDYDVELGDSLWGVYQMIGKLSPRAYVLRVA
jgi:ubiquinone/menaquinone biosynthesis C-methylase UbiE